MTSPRSGSEPNLLHINGYLGVFKKPARQSARSSTDDIHTKEKSAQNDDATSTSSTPLPTSPNRLVYFTDEIRGSTRFRDGLYQVSGRDDSLPVKADLVFITENNRHPYRTWYDKKEDVFWPQAIQEELGGSARVWTFGYRAARDDPHPIETGANNFIDSYTSQRNRTSAPSGSDGRIPRLIFVALGFGGVLVKKILLNCLRASDNQHQLLWHTCTGVVFLMTPHLARQRNLRRLVKWTNFYPGVCLTSLKPRDLLRDTESINETFLRMIDSAPKTYSVINQRLFSHRPDKINGTFPSGHQSNDHRYHLINEHRRTWYKSVKRINDQHLFDHIITRLQEWQTAPLRSESQAPALLSNEAQSGVRLLSLDGGGVRGLCSLLVLDRIMQEIEKLEIQRDPSSRGQTRIPADYFDLAGGTSTGGLICIMLFRLRMDIRSAIVEYKRLSPRIFRQSPSRYIGSKIIKSAFGMPWFKGSTLETAVKQIVEDRLSYEERASLQDVSEATLRPTNPNVRQYTCKTFACAVRKHDEQPILFRSYTAPLEADREHEDCKIWEAARATSAAPFYFPSARVGGDEGTKFWDGGLALNNPVKKVWAEKDHVFPNKSVACIISLGTGSSEKRPTKSFLPVIGRVKLILKNLTDVQRDHKDFMDDQGQGQAYFRFDPTTGDDVIGLADYKMLDVLEQHTLKYLNFPDVEKKIKECAERLTRIPQETQGREVIIGGADEASAGSNNTKPKKGYRRRLRNWILQRS